jgi:predicted amidohydrolase
MDRPLTAALAQYAPLAGADSVLALHRQASDICSATDDLDLIVFPEIHALGGCDAAGESTEWLTAAAEPLDDPRTRALSRALIDLPIYSRRIDPTTCLPKGRR